MEKTWKMSSKSHGKLGGKTMENQGKIRKKRGKNIENWENLQENWGKTWGKIGGKNRKIGRKSHGMLGEK